MVSKTVFVIIGIAVGVFFAGLGVGYALFINTYNPYAMMGNPTMFSQMMGKNPQISGQYMGYMMQNPQYMNQWMSQNPQYMGQWMGSMMQDSQLRQQMMEQMYQNPQFMQHIMADPQHMKFMNDFMKQNATFMHGTISSMMNNTSVSQQMMTEMMQNQQFMQQMMQHNFTGPSMMTQSTSNKTPFNPDVPINIPVLEGNYNGTKVYFIHTEVSDKDIADMMTDMINFPTLQVSNLADIPPKDLDKVYVFVNGVPRSSDSPRPHGGGPFGFQEDVFDSTPGQEQYRQFKVPQIVKWNEGSNPRILTSVDEILQAQANGEVSIQKTDVVVNAPIIVWQSQDGKRQAASEIDDVFHSMPGFKGKVADINNGNFIATLKLVR